MGNRGRKTKNSARLCAVMLLGLVTLRSTAVARAVQSSEPSRQTESAPPTLTLLDALTRAQQNDPHFRSAVSNVRVAHEDRRQSWAALLPSLDVSSQYLNTQGNGVIPTGRFVTNDGVHVYREWSVVSQDLSPATLMNTGYKRAIAAETIAQGKSEIARLGLAVTVTKAYYALVTAQRKYATAQQGLDQANRFVTTSQSLERSGAKPHSDVAKFQLQQAAQETSFREAAHAMESARLDLAVLLFPDFNENFGVVDDLRLTPAVPSFSELLAMAEANNPNLRVAMSTVRAADLSISAARQAFLPSLTVEVDYGIEASCVGLRCVEAIQRNLGPAPTVGYFLTGVLTLPVWDWGIKKSKLKQAEIKQDQANVELRAARRQLVKEVHAAYEETQTARAHLDSLRHAAGLAEEGLRLNIPRYQAGQATALEIVDAHNSWIQANNALDDGELRYRVALATLQTITGRF